MKKFLLFFILIIMLVSVAKNAAAQFTYTWNGGTSGAWSTASNWKVGGITALVPPGTFANDIAVVNTSNATITYSGTTTNSLSSLQTTSYGVSGITISFGSGTALAVTGGLTINQPSSTSAVFTFSGSGTLTLGGTTTSLYQGGITISSGTTCVVNGTIDFSGSQSVLINAGTLKFQSGSTLKLGDNSYITNSGTVSATSATFSLTGSGSSHNTEIYNTGNFGATSSTFTMSGSVTGIQNTTSTGVFNSKTCTYSFTNNPSSAFDRIYNTGTFTDHGSTISMTGQKNDFYNTVVSGSPAVMNFHGSSITLSSGNTLININNAGTFTADSTSTINITSQSSYITNSGTFNAGTSGSSCVITLGAQSDYVTNSNIFVLGSTSIIYPTASLTSIANTAGTFTLKSDVNGSAAIGAFAANATCTGTFNVERYFQGSSSKSNGRYIYRGYRIISSAVHNSATYPASGGYQVYGLNYIVGATAGKTTEANSTTNAFITGCTGGNTGSGNPSIYLYKESVIPSNVTFTSGNFIGISNITNSSTTGTISTSDGATNPSIPIGNGVLFFDRGQATNWSTRTVSPYIPPESLTLTSTGLLNTQTVTVRDWNNTGSTNLNYTVTGVGTGSNTNYAVRGFNMVGNPYPSSIDWNKSWTSSGITATNLSAAIWVFNTRTNQYDTFTTSALAPTTGTGNATNIIASGQGFFVKGGFVPANPSSLVFSEAAKSATSQVTNNNLLMGAPVNQQVAQTLRLKLVTDSINYDDIIIGFNPAASSKFNQMEDGQYIPGNGAAEGLSSFSDDGVKLAINYQPLPKLTPQTIKLFVTAAKSGLYTFERTALDAVPAIYEVWLMDKYKKDSLDIRNNNTYAFNIDLTDTMSYGKNRFEILIRQNLALGVHLLQFTAAKIAKGSQITWKTENEVNYTNFTVERSIDNGITFNVVGGFVSSALGSYSVLDSSPAIGANQYRLKLEDLNGTITYSKVVTLQYANGTNNITINNISVYPNPAISTINLAIAQAGSQSTNNLQVLQSLAGSPVLNTAPTGSLSYGIKIMNITGAVVKNSTSATATWQDNVSSLSPGTYIIQVTNNKDKSVVGKSTFVKL